MAAEGFEIGKGFVAIGSEDKTAEGTSKIGSSLAKWAAGLGIGALISKGIAESLDISAANAKLTAQMGLTQTDAANAGKAAGDVYRSGWGGSIEEVNDSIKGVGQNITSLGSLTKPELEAMSASALALSQTFGLDVAESTRAVGSLMKNGLAPDAKSAFDLITAGEQQGVDKAGDLLETFTEYSPQFAKLGIDGPMALNLLSTGLKNGARDTDVIADGFKEFSLRAIDGSKKTAQGFKDLGLDAEDMAAKIAKGGPSAEGATMQTLQALAKIKDPIKQNAAGVALFGTQWEDTFRQIVGPISNVKGGLDNVTGSTERMKDSLSSTPQAKIEGVKREFDGLLNSAVATEGPVGNVAAGIAAFGGQGITAAASITTIATSLGGVSKAAGTAALGMVKSAGSAIAAGATWVATAVAQTATIAASWLAMAARTTASAVASLAAQAARWVVTAAIALASAAQIALAWLISLGPIALVIAAVIALVAVIVLNFDTIKRWIGEAWDWIKNATSVFVGWLKAAWDAVWSAIVTAVTTYINAVKAVINLVWNAITAYITFTLNAWKTVITSVWNGIVIVVTTVINAIKTVITTVIGGITTAWQNTWNTAKNFVTTAWTNIKTSVTSGISGVVSLVTGLPSKIISALGSVGTMLYNSGKSIIQGLINGITGMLGNVKNAISNVLTSARNLLPFSPAKEGPFSGKGWTLYSGQSISNALATGIESGTPAVRSATADLAATAAAGLPTGAGTASAAGGSSGGVSIGTLTIQVEGSFDFGTPGAARELAERIREELRTLDREVA